MSGTPNPYAAALAGLDLPDPVAAFFAFCKERERIRERREAGDAPPWTEDPVLRRGRFLNVFREDDRVSRSILRLCADAPDLPTLVHALFFARWCNRQATLDPITLPLLADRDALIAMLRGVDDPPWCNVAAYPVEPVQWDGVTYSRWDAASDLFGRIKRDLAALIEGAGGDVVAATDAVNARFGMSNSFPIFMAVIDVAWFRPDIIDPASEVPTGIGAVPYLDRLEQHLGLASHAETCTRMIELQAEHWPEARRALQPIDVEYLSCECRKYYSYVNGTKRFEGKNAFVPGQSPLLDVDIPSQPLLEAPIATRIHVIAGGPCSGKTTLLNALAEAGRPVHPETARRLLEAGIAEGKTAAELRADPAAWQTEIFRQDHALFDGLPRDEVVFTDTSFIEDLVFAADAGLQIGPRLESWLRHLRYAVVFFLDPLPDYETGGVRLEDAEQARRISDRVEAAYRAYGYTPVRVPFGTVSERVAFIEANIAD
ncbi:MAG: ATP-binding protein [Proteobacteria bacterium]|nr:ATP-binding protein [Pseudomonadota bacterium]